MPYRRNRRPFRHAVRRFRARFRKRRRGKYNKTYYSKKNNTNNAVVGRRRGRVNLRTRVKRLESTTKKHFDYVSSRADGQRISWNGTDLNVPTNESFSSLLAIQGRNSTGDIPPVSGSARGTDENVREGNKVFCTKCRIRCMVQGITPNWDISGIAWDDQAFPLLAQAVESACHTRIHMLILKDRRPSTIDPVTGLFEPNPLPVNPFNPLEGMFQLEGLTANNTLGTCGLDSALRNYTSNRFSIVHTEVVETTMARPRKWFDVNLKINRTLTYKLPIPGGLPTTGSDPVNLNYLVYFAVPPIELLAISQANFIIQGTPLLVNPRVKMLTSRTYFTET